MYDYSVILVYQLLGYSENWSTEPIFENVPPSVLASGQGR